MIEPLARFGPGQVPILDRLTDGFRAQSLILQEAWDREFMDRWRRNDRSALLDYTDEQIYAEAGQGGFEIRTLLAVSAAAAGAKGTVHFCEPIPIFAVSCTIATYDLDLS